MSIRRTPDVTFGCNHQSTRDVVRNAFEHGEDARHVSPRDLVADTNFADSE